MSYIEDLGVQVSSDPRASAEIERLTKEKDEKRRRIKNLLPIVIPILLVALMIATTVPSFVAKKNTYSKAEELMKTGFFDESKETFESLGDYADSREKAAYAVEYYRALDIAGQGDEMIDKQGDKAIEKYEEAIGKLKSLSHYGESDVRIDEIQHKIDLYDESVRLGRYEAATELMKQCKYVSAKEEFEKLRNYKDSAEMAKECIYERAMKLMNYINSKDNLRGIYANPTYDEQDYTIEETQYPVLKMKPICDVAKEEFLSLGDYKDSADLAEICADKGNFTKEFFELCRNGQIAQASQWLNTYSDEFDERAAYTAMISAYSKFVTTWKLYKGDQTLLPISGGFNGKCAELESTIYITDGICTFGLKGIDADFDVRMSLTDTGNSFILSPDEHTFYYATINNQNHLTYSRYDGNGKNISACEYEHA